MPRKHLSAILLALLTLASVFSPSTLSASTFKVLYTFGNLPDGNLPIGGLVIDSAGNIYGTTQEGGTGTGCGFNSGCGTFFRLSPNSDGTYAETILFNFLGESNTGAFPGGLIFDSAGNLYGTTGTGGPCDDLGCGTVFEFTPNGDGTWNHITLFDFPGLYDGTFPTYGLTFDSAGNFYGTTSEGGTHNCGTIYEMSPNGATWTHTVLYNFQCGVDGSSPQGGLLRDTQGNFYGVLLGGAVNQCPVGMCGAVFEFIPTTPPFGTLKSLHNFTGGSDGGYPVAALSSNGVNLFGTTYLGGDTTCYPNDDEGCGVLYKLTANSDNNWTESVIHEFEDRIDGALPNGQVIFDASGNLYGTSQQVIESRGYGDVFRATPVNGGWSAVSLHHFVNPQLEGAAPNSLTLDGKGNVFGTAYYGGTLPCGVNSQFGCGVVFEITP